jgi:lipopolysaccharide transport system permease protein
MSESKERYITPPKGFSLGLSEMWEYKELFYFFTWRDVKVKYKQSVLGFGWAVLQPFLVMVVMSYFFGKGMGVAEKTGGIPYPIFIYSGFMLWSIFATGLSGAGNSMVKNANIIKKIYFPRLIIPLSSILVAVFDFLMALLVFIGIIIYYNQTTGLEVNILKMTYMIPICVLLVIIATLGMGSLIGALNVKYRDFQYVIPFMVQLLLFLTPVLYPLDWIQNKVVALLCAVNPMYGPVVLVKNAIMDTPVDMSLVWVSLVSNLVFLVIGILYFKKTEAYFADIA